MTRASPHLQPPSAPHAPTEGVKHSRRAKRPVSEVSVPGSVRIAHLTSTHSLGAIDRRWQIAAGIVLGSSTPWRMRKVIDADIKMAIRYLTRRAKNDAKFAGKFADIHHGLDSCDSRPIF